MKSTKGTKAKAVESVPWTPRVLLPLTVHDRIRLRHRSLVDEDTIKKWASGKPNMRESTKVRLERACAELGIELRA